MARFIIDVYSQCNPGAQNQSNTFYGLKIIDFSFMQNIIRIISYHKYIYIYIKILVICIAANFI